jgi:hypothetical protein
MILHVLNGDATRVPLEQSGVPGQLLVHVDVLHDGPAPAGFDREGWRRVRAEHLAGDAYPPDDIVQSWRDADATLERYAAYDEVVFWFEHDLFDQLLLIRHLDWLSRVSDLSRFRLICIGEFPGHPRFAGLGELNPRELASLFPDRRPITAGQVALGSTLWAAFTAPDPRPFASLVLDGDTAALPFAAGALRRHLEDFPAIANGLARTERQILTALEGGARSAHEIFAACGDMEERRYMGDLTFWTILRRLTRGRTPLMATDGSFPPDRPPSGTFTLTPAGGDVLHGHADHLALNGIDRWMGGVHLTDGRYRWDGSTIVLLV